VIVLDASAVVELLLAGAAGARVAQRIADPAETLHAPHLLDLEVAQVFRRHARAGLIDDERAQGAFAVLSGLGVSRHGHAALLDRIWALRERMSAYDAAYVALAEVLGAPLITFDARLAATSDHGAAIELLTP